MDMGRFLIETHLRTGRPIKELAAAHDISASWLFKLLRRHRLEGAEGLAPRSRRPHRSPTRIADLYEDEIVAVHKALADDGLDAGAATIHYHLAQRYEAPPSISTIFRVLKSRGFVALSPQKREELVQEVRGRPAQRDLAGAWVGEEMASEVFSRAFANRRSYDLSKLNARPWLLGIALNVVRESRRSIARGDAAYRRAATSPSAGSIDPATFTAAALDASKDLARVALALAEFPPEEVETLLLHIWDELSYIECAEALGIPVGTVRSRLNRVRNRLRAVLDDRPAKTITPLHREVGGTDEGSILLGESPRADCTDSQPGAD